MYANIMFFITNNCPLGSEGLFSVLGAPRDGVRSSFPSHIVVWSSHLISSPLNMWLMRGLRHHVTVPQRQLNNFSKVAQSSSMGKFHVSFFFNTPISEFQLSYPWDRYFLQPLEKFKSEHFLNREICEPIISL